MGEKQFRLLIRNQVLTVCEAADGPKRPEDRMLELENGWLNLPEGLTGIGDRAFESSGGCNVRIPSSVRWIGEHAFFRSGCWEVELPEGLTQIEEGCFEESSLRKVNLPQTITRIGRRAFRKTNLETLELPAGLETIGEAAFAECASLWTLTFPEGIRELPEKLFYRCLSLNQVVIPDSVEKIGNRAFYGCDSLKTIRFPDTLEELPEYVCSDCTHLTTVHFPANLKHIRDWALGDCASLQNLQLPDGLLTIGKGAFQWGRTKYELEDLQYDAGPPDLVIPASVCNLPDLADLFEDWFVRVTILGEAFLQSVPKERPWLWGKTEDRVLRAPDIDFLKLPLYIVCQHLKGFAELCLEGIQMGEEVRKMNMAGLRVLFCWLWPHKPTRTVLLDQKNMNLICAQALVKDATEKDMPELVTVLLEYINRTFSQEELDQEREKRQKALLADL